MSNRLIKFLIIFLLIFSAQLIILQVLLIRPQIAKAALPRVDPLNEEETKTKCPCSSQASTANEAVRLYIPIPWVTDACGYVCDVNNDGRANVVDYIVSIYKFLVGMAAILAVIMIVWGGLLWIFSAGNPNRISTAKDTVVSAIIGLVLALVSVSLLQAINPALTNVELPDLRNIGRITVSGIFATDDDIMLYEEKEVVAYTQNSALQFGGQAEQKAEQRGIAVIIPQAQAQTESRVEQLLGQEMAYESSDKKKLQDNYGCGSDGKMCFLIIKDNLQKGNELVLGSQLKCNSKVDVKVAHINFKKIKDPITGKTGVDKTIIESIDCYHGLCDKEKNMYWDWNITAISEFVRYKYNNIIYDEKTCAGTTACIKPNEGKDVGSAFAYGQDCSEIGSTGLCLVEYGKGSDAVRCVDVKSLCESTDAKACDDVNNQIHNEDLYGDKFKDMGCARRYDRWLKGFGFGGGDNCQFGPILYCPLGWDRVSYRSSNEGECWKGEEDGIRKPKNMKGFSYLVWNQVDIYVADPHAMAVKGAAAICCKSQNLIDGVYKYQALTDFWSISIANDLKKYNLDLKGGQCKDNAGKNLKEGIEFRTINGELYKDKAIPFSVPTIYTQSKLTGQNEVSFCYNDQSLKVCYIPHVSSGLLPSMTGKPDFSKGIFSNDKIVDCINRSSGVKVSAIDLATGGIQMCGAYLVPKEFCCIGDTAGGVDCGTVEAGEEQENKPEYTRGDEKKKDKAVGGNPLKDKPEWNTAFKAGAGIIQGYLGNDLVTAESFLRALAIVESGGAPNEQSDQGYCGLMQLSAGEARNLVDAYNKEFNPDISKDNIDCKWLQDNPASSIKLAALYIQNMLDNSDTKLCPGYVRKYNRDCDYNEPANDKTAFYSPCRDIMKGSDTKKKMQYIYGAYNSGPGGNCHNQTNFFNDKCPPPGDYITDTSIFCPDYLKKQGSIWECDKKFETNSYWQTRAGAARLIDCQKQFYNNINLNQLSGCCAAGQQYCVKDCGGGTNIAQGAWKQCLSQSEIDNPEDQLKDASNELNDLLNCVIENTTWKPPIKVGGTCQRLITSISDSQGIVKCVIDYEQPPCAHAEFSCHYGGETKKCRDDYKSYAVDIQSKGDYDIVRNVFENCAKQLGEYFWSKNESDKNHYHFQIDCGSPNDGRSKC